MLAAFSAQAYAAHATQAPCAADGLSQQRSDDEPAALATFALDCMNRRPRLSRHDRGHLLHAMRRLSVLAGFGHNRLSGPTARDELAAFLQVLTAKFLHFVLLFSCPSLSNEN
jgi:hypothetical protein